MADFTLKGQRRQPARFSWFRFAGVFAIFLVTVNLAALGAAPALFEVDRARGPYTAANNFELTRVYAQALEGYTEVAKNHPESRYFSLARIGIANSLAGLGHRAEAAELYDQLLVDLIEDPDYALHRLTILSRLASILEDAGDADAFQEVYTSLLTDYPDAEATRRAARYAEDLKAAQAAAEADASHFDDLVTVSSDQAPVVGEPFSIVVTIMPGAVEPGPFGLAVNLAFWEHVDLVGITPSPASTSEFWARRFFQFTLPDDGLEIAFLMRAESAGDFVFDLDLEKAFELVELGLVVPVEVAAP
ncbi:MAG: hypothetical protein JJ920_01420 [Roseitalea sp.]|nr:hypothetical protein [Roseitalea sp.]MBO6722675.1 hypothetical protein [Roseitalea sp.]MBO6741541.1 hypothetical protein [Roseitalea sp.]